MGVALMLSTPGRQRAAWFVIGVLVMCVVMQQLYSNTTTAQLAVDIRENQKSGRAVLDRINDCTTPGRKCFDEAQRRTAGVVGDINRVAIYAAACGAQYPGQVAAVEGCVRQQMAMAKAAEKRKGRGNG